jgi:hypothetical protein
MVFRWFSIENVPTLRHLVVFAVALLEAGHELGLKSKFVGLSRVWRGNMEDMMNVM